MAASPDAKLADEADSLQQDLDAIYEAFCRCDLGRHRGGTFGQEICLRQGPLLTSSF